MILRSLIFCCLVSYMPPAVKFRCLVSSLGSPYCSVTVLCASHQQHTSDISQWTLSVLNGKKNKHIWLTILSPLLRFSYKVLRGSESPDITPKFQECTSKKLPWVGAVILYCASCFLRQGTVSVWKGKVASCKRSAKGTREVCERMCSLQYLWFL